MGVIADKIRKAIFGSEVRDSIADGIEVVEQLREDYDNQVINAGNSNAEIVDARGGHIKLKDRLDQVDSHLETKANKSEIGSPLIANNISEMTDTTKVYVNTTDGKWYSYNGSTWVAGGIYNSQGIGNNSIGIEKLNFHVKSLNLFDKSTVTNDKYFNGSTSIVDDSSGIFSVSDYIEVEPNTSYIKSDTQYATYYDINKNPISINSSPWNILSTPSNCYYVRLNVKKTLLSTYMLVKGTTLPSTYQSYYLGIDGTKIKYPFNYETFLNETDVYNILKKEGTIKGIKVEDCKFFNIGLNLFNKHEVEENLFFDYSFTPKNSDEYDISYFIPVKPNTSYIKSDGGYGIYCDKDRKTLYTNRISGSNFTTPADCYYVRVNVRKILKNSYMVVQGNTLPMSYIPFTYNLVNCDLKDEYFTSIGDSYVGNGGWQDVVKALLGMEHYNRGVGGTTIAYRPNKIWVNSDGSYAGYPGSGNTQPEGTTEILDYISGEGRINTIPENSKIIFGMGLTNDFSQNIPLGTINDITDTTFYGAVYCWINRIRAKFPTTPFIIIIPPQSIHKDINTLGLTKYDYVKALIEMCEKEGCPMVNCWTLWNKTNASNFLESDLLHPNHKGKMLMGLRISKETNILI